MNMSGKQKTVYYRRNERTNGYGWSSAGGRMQKPEHDCVLAVYSGKAVVAPMMCAERVLGRDLTTKQYEAIIQLDLLHGEPSHIKTIRNFCRSLNLKLKLVD